MGGLLLRLAALAATVLATLAVIEPASGAPSCATRVLRDWSDDGHVASRYSPPCYEQAIDALPTDLRDYTNAQDVITRALAQAVRRSDPERTGTATAAVAPRVAGAATTPPLALVAVIVATAMLLIGGAASYVVRRMRGADVPDELGT